MPPISQRQQNQKSQKQANIMYVLYVYISLEHKHCLYS